MPQLLFFPPPSHQSVSLLAIQRRYDTSSSRWCDWQYWTVSAHTNRRDSKYHWYAITRTQLLPTTYYYVQRLTCYNTIQWNSKQCLVYLDHLIITSNAGSCSGSRESVAIIIRHHGSRYAGPRCRNWELDSRSGSRNRDVGELVHALHPDQSCIPYIYATINNKSCCIIFDILKNGKSSSTYSPFINGREVEHVYFSSR